jgi:alkylhydroperoxidase family enzyme
VQRVRRRTRQGGDQVPDTIWDAAAEHFDETQLAALVLDIATVNLWNRLHIATRQVVGQQSW